MTSMAETYEMLQQIVPAIAPTLTPPEARNVMQLVIETSNLPHEVKQRFKQASEQAAQAPPQPDPAVEAEKAKTMMKLESEQAMSQMKAKEQQDNMQAKQIENMMDIEHKERMANMEYAIKARMADVDMQVQTQKANTDMQVQREKSATDLDVARQKGDMAVEHESKKARARGDNKNLASGKAQEFEAIDQLAKVIRDGFKTVVEAQNESADEIKTLITTPKQITVQRDRSGKVTGATARASAP
jgi:hypothetical protein